MSRLRLTPAARRDIQEIAHWTGARWGEDRRQAYLDRLADALQHIAANPEIGRAREDVSPGLRSLAVERHVVFYRIGIDRIGIIRILHQRMKASRHVGDEEGT